jgi:beta-galactosidase
MDGVLQSDHTPNSGLIEYKKALEPVQVISYTAKSFTIINRLDFTTLDHLECTWSVFKEAGGTIELPAGLRPGAPAELDIPEVAMQLQRREEAPMNISFRLKQKPVWAEVNYELAWAQIPVPVSQIPVSLRATLDPSPQGGNETELLLQKQGTELRISGRMATWTFDTVRGRITSWRKLGGAPHLMTQPMEPTFYRALTDNDAPRDGREWKERELHLAHINTRKVEWRKEGDSVVVTANQKFGPPVLSWSLDLTCEYTFASTGEMRLVVKGVPRGLNLPSTLPRIGITFGLAKTFTGVHWYGRGPGESYKDFKLSQRVGEYKLSIDDLWTAPEFPQECSNRTDTRMLRLVHSAGGDLRVGFFDPKQPKERRLFDFMVSHYDVKDIDEARHPFELERKRQEDVIVRVDADHHGLGTGSCGPKTLEAYALKTEPFKFGISMY